MAWFKVDDGFHGHPKVVDLSLEAVGLWTVAGSWCAQYLTDGFVPDKTLRRLGGAATIPAELAEAGLWEPTEDGWQFKDWTDYQPTKAEVEAERDAARERMKKVRAAKKGVRSDEQPPNVQANNTRTFGGSSGEVRSTPPVPPDPPIPPQRDAQKRKPEKPLPDEWSPSSSNAAYALTNGIDLDHEVDQFRSHAHANDRRQRDWDAAFRTWLGNAKKWAKPQRLDPNQRAMQTLQLATDLPGMLEVEE